ncbi:MAG TPA: sulfite exporter TauE/SafE family protein [Limnobacter sp.]|nr:sulfite exporter TauE/SafE family protein [Limnobacter sp.]
MSWPAVSELMLVLGLGAGLGFFGGLFGIGGGIIAVPLFIIGLGMDQALAQGTALVLMVPNLLIGWWRYNRHHRLPWQAVAAIGTTATFTTWLTAKLAVRIDPDLLHWIFNLFILAVGVRMLLLRKHPGGSYQQSDTPRLAAMPVVGMLGGTSMGLLGMGGGLVATPLLTTLYRHTQTTAQALSLALVAPSSVVALLTYASARQVDWSLGMPLAIGGLFTVSAGVAVAHHLPEKILRRGFGSVMIMAAFWLIVQSIHMHPAFKVKIGALELPLVANEAGSPVQICFVRHPDGPGLQHLAGRTCRTVADIAGRTADCPPGSHQPVAPAAIRV